MKKTIALFICFVISVLSHADTEVVDGITWQYTVADGKVSLGGGQNSSAVPVSTSGSITIPSTLGGYPVTNIGADAFASCYFLKSVTIPDSITSIENAAFECSGITSITIPESVISIGDRAFWACLDLTSVTIPRGVTSIGNSAFSGCNGLTSVTISDGVTSVGESAFYGCSGLTSVTIPDSVTSIGDWAFRDCTGLTSVTIGNSVTNIRWGAFYGCSGLTRVTIPESVVSIGQSAFEGCSGLLSVIILDGVTSIGDYAFWNCISLKLAYVPHNCKKDLPASVFQNCDSGLQVIYYDENMKFFDETLTTEDNSSTNLVAVCTNSCRVSFQWKCSCEPIRKGKVYDYLDFEIDGVRQDLICGETDWQEKSYEVLGDGEHIFRWTYRKDEEDSAGEDCAWVKHVVVAPRVTLSFDGGEATEGEPPTAMSFYADDESVVLPDCGTLSFAKHTFVGWSDGEIVYVAGAECPYQRTEQMLTAVWVANTLSAPVIVAPEEYEADSVAVTITADDGAIIYYTLDGTDPTINSVRYEGVFEIIGSANIRAVAVMDNYYDSEVSTVMVTRLPWTFGECLNCPERTFTTGGDAVWARAKGVSDDGFALQSGDITHSQTSRLDTVVYGAGTIEFRCKVDGEIVKKEAYDGLAFCIDDVQQEDLIGDNEWVTKSFAVTGDGWHTLSWLYVKDEEGDGGGEDCAWLDEVVWTPKPVAPVVNINTDTMEEPKETEAGVKTIAAKENQTLSQEDADAIAITIVMESEQEPVDTTAGYNKTYDPNSNTIVITLKEPEVGAEATEQEVAKVEGDATGMLADVPVEELSTEEPTPTAEEEAAGTTVVSALPVKAVKGLYYQASWGSDLSNMRQGEKVQATGDTLYLGVIKQQATQGFYKVTVSEQ